MFIQTGVLKHGMGSPGMDELRWLKPVRPGDTLHMEAEVLSTRSSGSRTDRGYVSWGCHYVNQEAETVMTLKVLQICRTRSGGST